MKIFGISKVQEKNYTCYVIFLGNKLWYITPHLKVKKWVYTGEDKKYFINTLYFPVWELTFKIWNTK